jgi:hypothetical protein
MVDLSKLLCDMSERQLSMVSRLLDEEQLDALVVARGISKRNQVAALSGFACFKCPIVRAE